MGLFSGARIMPLIFCTPENNEGKIIVCLTAGSLPE
jgi:hypothetical protein